MRLSTVPDRDEASGVAVLHAALDAGVTFFDTADAYCWDTADTGHNERLIARALATWGGDRSRAPLRIATKGGLTRPAGRWLADGRARSLASACEASLQALNVERLDLYQLHAPDPRTPFATSVRALHDLQRRGFVQSIGLCNVTVGQIEAARRITDIASVQVELSIWQDASILSGVLPYCETHGIELIAYRPLGGPERRRRLVADPLLSQMGAEYGASNFEIALAALIGLSPVVRPIPGPTRVATAQSAARARQIALTDADRDRLAERFPACRAVRQRTGRTASILVSSPNREVVMVMGLPGAGKSTVAAALVDEGYVRLNRDHVGGSLAGLVPLLDRAIRDGTARVVLDNTYVSRKSRAAVIQAAAERGLPVRCLWLATTLEDAQVNVVVRMMARYGRLLGPEEMKGLSRGDVSVLAPMVQFRYQRELEPPDPAEGFSRVDVVNFQRRHDPAFVNRALILWCDGGLCRSRSGRPFPIAPDDVDVDAGRAHVLRRYAADGWTLLGMSWRPEVADGAISAGDAEAVFAAVQEPLGVRLEVAFCPHGAGPPTCWCRKPLPGLGVLLIQRHRLDPGQCLYVGSGAQDPGFARKLGFQYRDADEFFRADARKGGSEE